MPSFNMFVGAWHLTLHLRSENVSGSRWESNRRWKWQRASNWWCAPNESWFVTFTRSRWNSSHQALVWGQQTSVICFWQWVQTANSTCAPNAFLCTSEATSSHQQTLRGQQVWFLFWPSWEHFVHLWPWQWVSKDVLDLFWHWSKSDLKLIC